MDLQVAIRTDQFADDLAVTSPDERHPVDEPDSPVGIEWQVVSVLVGDDVGKADLVYKSSDY
jgi:hypothetical protein